MQPKFLKQLPTRKVVFAAVILLVQIGLIWPVYAWFGSIRPLILGLPLSFFWVVLMLTIAFAALITLYFTDSRSTTAAQNKN